MKRIILLSLTVATMATISGFTFLMHASGITGCSGSPVDGGTCSGCHGGGTAPTVVISAIPAFGSGNTTYVPSTTYTISVVGSGTAKYGLNVEILNGSTSSATNAGTWGTVVTTNCKTSGTAPTTLTHNQSSTSGTFSFKWTAPASGSVYLYSCVLGANGDGGTSGDKIKQTNITLTAASSAPSLTVTTTSVNSKCSNSNTGSATATANGTAPYTYSWNTNPIQTTATATGLAAGTYSVTVHDANGTSTSAVTVTAPTAITPNVTTTNTSCGGSTGTASASASGGTSGYTYLWSNGKATASITGLAIGMYTVTVTDVNGCTATGVANIQDAGGPSTVTTPTPASTCSASDGSITSTVSGGSAPYTYLWSNGKTTSAISGLPTGSYTLTVTDHVGCAVNSVVTVSCTGTGTSASVSSITTPTGTMCASSFVPKVTVKNLGTPTMTSCTINYYYDSNPVLTSPWAGSLASGASINVNLPAIAGVSVGAHTFYSSVVNPNGSPNLQPLNGQSQSTFNVSNTSMAIPLAEGFESSANLPTGWTLVDPDNSVTWQVVTTAGHNSNQSIGFNNCNGMGTGVNMAGRIDKFITSAYDFTSATNTSGLSFDVAYSVLNYKNQLFTDTLAVYYSTDCGTTWIRVYLKGGTSLSNSITTQSCWTPAASDWRTDNIGLGNLAGKPSVMFAFENRSDWGEWVYVDNININVQGNGVESINSLAGFSIYPNPASTSFTIEGASSVGKVHYSIYNVIGEEAKAGDIISNGSTFNGTIQANDFPRGMYFIKISDGTNSWTKKLNIQ